MKKPLGLLVVLPLVVLLAACGSSPHGQNGKTHVVASFYPFAFIAEQVGGSFVDVENLTSPGVEPHDLELKPKQVGAVQGADLVVYEKHFQAAVDAAVDQANRSNGSTIDVASLITLKPVQRGSDGKGEDPHTWLDPPNMIVVAKAVTAQLSEVDPAHADAYATNANKLVSQLSGLDAAFSSGLKTCRTRTIVTSHAAFQYLGARYHLTQVPIAGIDPTNEPSPSQLATIATLVRAQKLTTIFTEALVSPAVARTIADETGVATATLDPIEGLSDKTHDENYVTLMRKNLAAIRKANSCS